MVFSRLIKKVDRQHTMGPVGLATSTITNIRTIGRYFERVEEHNESDSPEYPSAYDGKTLETYLKISIHGYVIPTVREMFFYPTLLGSMLVQIWFQNPIHDSCSLTLKQSLLEEHQ